MGQEAFARVLGALGDHDLRGLTCQSIKGGAMNVMNPDRSTFTIIPSQNVEAFIAAVDGSGLPHAALFTTKAQLALDMSLTPVS